MRARRAIAAASAATISRSASSWKGATSSPYEPAQYRALSNAIHALCRAYPSLSPERIAGHSDIAPGRKTDPGPAFDWPRLRALLRLPRG